jgi:hypothetical protein
MEMPRVIRTSVILHVKKEVEVAPGIRAPPGAYYGRYLQTSFSEPDEPRTGWSDPRYMIVLSPDQLKAMGVPADNLNAAAEYDVTQHVRNGDILA